MKRRIYKTREEAIKNRFCGDRMYYDAYKENYYLIRLGRYTLKEKLIIFYRNLTKGEKNEQNRRKIN